MEDKPLIVNNQNGNPNNGHYESFNQSPQNPDQHNENNNNHNNQNQNNNNANADNQIFSIESTGFLKYLEMFFIFIFGTFLVLMYIFSHSSNFTSETQCETLRGYSQNFIIFVTLYLVISLFGLCLKPISAGYICFKFTLNCTYIIIWFVFFILFNIGYNKGEDCGFLTTLILIYLVLYYILLGFLAVTLLCICCYFICAKPTISGH